jgi:NDP-sugar pyrophosphorylase family protein
MMLPVAILAGGLATRMRPATDKIPKSLIPVAGKPFIEHQVRLLKRNGVSRIVICAGYLGEMIESFLGNGNGWGLQIDYVYDGPGLLGTGGALLKAVPRLGERFLILYGDAYLDCDYGAVETAFFRSGQSGIMTVYRNANRWDRSNIEFSGGKIVRYDKTRTTPAMEYIDYGLGGLRSKVLADFPDHQPFDLEAVYQALIARQDLAGYEVDRRFYEIGSPAGLAETERFLTEEFLK